MAKKQKRGRGRPARFEPAQAKQIRSSYKKGGKTLSELASANGCSIGTIVRVVNNADTYS